MLDRNGGCLKEREYAALQGGGLGAPAGSSFTGGAAGTGGAPDTGARDSPGGFGKIVNNDFSMLACSAV